MMAITKLSLSYIMFTLLCIHGSVYTRESGKKTKHYTDPRTTLLLYSE
jgi:hypothetical protein